MSQPCLLIGPNGQDGLLKLLAGLAQREKDHQK